MIWRQKNVRRQPRMPPAPKINNRRQRYTQEFDNPENEWIGRWMVNIPGSKRIHTPDQHCSVRDDFATNRYLTTTLIDWSPNRQKHTNANATHEHIVILIAVSLISPTTNSRVPSNSSYRANTKNERSEELCCAESERRGGKNNRPSPKKMQH